MHSKGSLDVHELKAKSGDSFSLFKSNETLKTFFRNVHLNFYQKQWALIYKDTLNYLG